MIVRLLLPLLPFLPIGLIAPPPLMMDYTFPAGTSIWLNPLVLEGQTGMTIKGQRGNRGPSRMIYRGGPTKAPIQFIGCTRCKLLDLEIVIESPGVESHLLIANSLNPPVDGYSTANLISNVRCPYTGSPHSPKYSFNVDSFAAGGTDGNNEQHRFDRCVTFAYTDAAFRARGSQCHQLVYDQCAAVNYGPGRPIGVHLEEGGHFTWRDGNTSYNATDFKFGTFEQNSIIDGNRSEGSTQFVVMGTAGGDALLSMNNVTWDCQPVAGKPVIDGYGPNTISIRDSWFAGTNGVCPTFRMRGVAGNLDLSGVLLRQHGGTAPTVPIITAGSTWESRFHGVRWQNIPAVGPRVTRPVSINKVPGVQ